MTDSLPDVSPIVLSNEFRELVASGELSFLKGLLANWSRDVELAIANASELMPKLVDIQAQLESVDPDSPDADSQLLEIARELEDAFLDAPIEVARLIVRRETRGRGASLHPLSVQALRKFVALTCIASFTRIGEKELDKLPVSKQAENAYGLLRGNGLPKELGKESLKGEDSQALQSEAVAMMNVLAAADSSILQTAFLKVSPSVQRILNEAFSSAAERQRRIELLGVDLYGLSRDQAVRSMNEWLKEHAGDFSDAANETKEAIVDCLRNISTELDSNFCFKSKSIGRIVSVTLTTDLDKAGRRRFTVRQQAGSRKPVAARYGLPHIEMPENK